MALQLSPILTNVSLALCSQNQIASCLSGPRQSAVCSVCPTISTVMTNVTLELATEMCNREASDAQFLKAQLASILSRTPLANLSVLDLIGDQALLRLHTVMVLVQTVRQLPLLLFNMSQTLVNFHIPMTERFLPQNIFLFCAAVFPVCRSEVVAISSRNLTRDQVVLPCPWLCSAASELVYLAGKFAADNVSRLHSSPIFQLLVSMSRCAAVQDQVGNMTWVSQAPFSYCSDPLCNSSAGKYICPLDSQEYANAKSSSNKVCVNSQCLFPLYRTRNPKHWSREAQSALHDFFVLVQNFFRVPMKFDGSLLPCGRACTGIIFDRSIESNMRTLVVVMAFITLFVQIFAIFSFLLNRNKLNRFPSRLLLYISICFSLACISFLVQVSTGWETIVCSSDGTLRYSLPGENSDGARSCVMVFLLTYFSLVAALMWWFCLTHAWFSTFRSMGKARNPAFMERGLPRQELIYHGIVWPVAIVLCAVGLQANRIDGVAMFGICFTTNDTVWFYLMTLPVIVLGVLGGPFLIKGILYLTQHRQRLASMRNLRRGSQAEASITGLQRYQAKLGILVVASFIHLLVQCAIGLYQRAQWKGWLDDIKAHVTCQLATCDDRTHLCPPLPEPSAIAFGILVVAVFLEGIVLCSWIATRENVAVWKKFYQNPTATLKHGVYDRLRRKSSGWFNSSRASTGSRRTIAMSKSQLGPRLSNASASHLIANSPNNVASGQAQTVATVSTKAKGRRPKRAVFKPASLTSETSESKPEVELSEYVTGADKFLEDNKGNENENGVLGVYVTGRDKDENDLFLW